MDSATSRPRFDRTILTRIAVPIVVVLALLAAVTHSSPVTSLVIFVVALVALAVTALTLGHDSREGSGWTRRHVVR